MNTTDGAHLRKLLEEALREQGGDAAQIAILGLQLDEKDKESRAAKQKTKELLTQIKLKQKELSVVQSEIRALESSQTSERDKAAAAIALLRRETEDLQEKLQWEQERARRAEEACQRLEGEIENLQMKIRLERQEVERRGKEEQLAAVARVRDLEAQITEKRGDLAFNRMQFSRSWGSYVGSDASDCAI